MNSRQTALQKIQSLLITREPASLGPKPRPSRESLDSLNEILHDAFSEAGLPVSNQALIRSLVLLWHDHLDESHTISQDLSGPDGSFLHGIMHRREPDYGNAKYWFQRVGEHPAFPTITAKAIEILDREQSTSLKAQLVPDGEWDPFAFIDACENATGHGDKTTIALLEEIQAAESRALLDHFLR